MKKLIICLIIFFLILTSLIFTRTSTIHARYAGASYLTRTGGLFGGFLGEELNFSVRVGTSLIPDPCNKTVVITTSRSEYDTITIVNAQAECNEGYAYFKIKSSQAGISTVTARVGETTIDIRDFQFFSRREGEVLIRPEGHSTTYLLRNRYKYRIKNPSMFNAHGFDWNNVVKVSLTEEHLYNLGKDYRLQSVLQLGDNFYYVVDDLKLSLSQDAIDNYEPFKSLNSYNVDERFVPELRRLYLISAESDEKVYYLTNGGQKRHIPSVAIFDSYGDKWEDVITMPSSVLNLFPDSSLIRLEGDYKVYKLENEQKRWIKTAEAFIGLGYNWDKIALVNQVEFSFYTTGEPIE